MILSTSHATPFKLCEFGKKIIKFKSIYDFDIEEQSITDSKVIRPSIREVIQRGLEDKFIKKNKNNININNLKDLVNAVIFGSNQVFNNQDIKYVLTAFNKRSKELKPEYLTKINQF